MDKPFSSFFSMACMVILLLIFAAFSAIATIVESVSGTDAAWAFIYGADWFGIIQLLLVINLSYNIYRYRLYNIKKLPVFLLHISFIFIFLGAAITRYVGFEGSMHIRENSQTNLISTREVYFQLMARDKDGKKVSKDSSQYISTNSEKNDFSMSIDTDGKDAVLKYKKFVLNGALKWVASPNGEPIVELLFSDQTNKKTLLLKSGDIVEIGDLDVAFNVEPKQKEYMQISLKDGKFYIKTNQNIEYMKMADMSKGVLSKDVEIPFDSLNLYTIDGVNFAPKTLLASAKREVVSLPQTEMGNNAVIADLSYNGDTKEVFTFFGDYPRAFDVGGKEFQVAWSPKMIELPFSLYLKDFEMDRYPGSNSPSGYSSQVVVKDGNLSMDFKIYMNHVLDYDGYRFFQSSYDRDEQGTILSVNKDPGKLPTYFGYFLLTVGMLFNFFNPNSRFLKLSRLIDESSKRESSPKKPEKHTKGKNSAKTIAGLLVALIVGFSTTNLQAYENPPAIDPAHAKSLETLVVQGFDGRMEPFDTLSRDVLNKVYRGEDYKGMSPSAVMLSLIINPDYWRTVPFIKVSDKELKKLLGMPENATHARFGNFYGKDDQNNTYYKLGKIAEEINRKPPGNRTKFDKDVVKVDERLNIFYMAFMSELFKIVPKENDPTNTWYSAYGAFRGIQGDEAKRVSTLLQNYFESVIDAQTSGDWSKANSGLELLKEYQRKVGAAVTPSMNKLNFEVLFNKAQIFQRLTPVYLIAGFMLLIFVFMRMMNPKLNMSFAFKSVYAVNLLAFLIHTTGLALRWYVSGHAPWANAYESLVYIAWSLSLSGIIFSRTSAISLSLTSILAGITLFVAHLSHIDPQITPLQPVLNSYWLTIHVSVITASYGFLGLGSLLGLFTLVLFIIKKSDKNDEISRNILEATRINEMSLILGLCLLTVGNFLGGVWANESWGRYWGWDSKETWSLVTILIYAAVIHMRFIPKVNSQYWFAVASMFSYASVIMTYFGVNFYLSGMHSYAAGESIPVPNVVWISALVMVILSVLAYFKRRYATRL
ncbi:cytochrome c biogenesis protein [Campylobacter geochelonis]|uniref:cytochrome c biogenesis protein n=1 Tax=Campylobacter geochelonis TaxID=1780362 RepID=UPI00077070CF|nr:cytochrome c biogenesis protein CcsA [Campylobacter geochelonis]CZE47517.1 CcmF/CcyK/CcsA family cytochrome c biogenesis protein [Campylobacter geochelonis]